MTQNNMHHPDDPFCSICLVFPSSYWPKLSPLSNVIAAPGPDDNLSSSGVAYGQCEHLNKSPPSSEERNWFLSHVGWFFENPKHHCGDDRLELHWWTQWMTPWRLPLWPENALAAAVSSLFFFFFPTRFSHHSTQVFCVGDGEGGFGWIMD